MEDTINRIAIHLRPKEKFLEWARTLDGDQEFDGMDLEGFCNTYLLDEAMDSGRVAIRKHLAKYWKRIAIEEFSAWWQGEEDWPVLKTIKDFEEFFIWGYSEIVCDLGKIRLEREGGDDDL